MKIGICAWVLPGEEIEAFRLAKEAGLKGVVIDYGGIDSLDGIHSEEGREAYLAEAKKYDLEIPTMAFNTFCGRGMTKVENIEYAKSVFEDGIAIADQMGIAKIQVPSFFDNKIETEADLSNTIEVFKYACELGEKYKVIIGSESVMTIAQHKRLYEEVNSPWLSTLFDSENPWAMVNQDGVELAKYMKDFTGELHAKDNVRDGSKQWQLGEGTAKFNQIMDIYAEDGFDQWIQLENNYGTMDNYIEVIQKDVSIIKGFFLRQWGRSFVSHF